jgi:hypothetical protein
VPFPSSKRKMYMPEGTAERSTGVFDEPTVGRITFITFPSRVVIVILAFAVNNLCPKVACGFGGVG